ncbi:cytochrome c biogenesis CcdA family protein [Tepidibacter hydrothermalis]|uniref:Cytochrome c biogenesis protein CcdA n=1 Tax=Tepidibacter hydrothermalis TaxID=3036126 RepID=A0ABY8E7G7_9FIRM|nr:cytochrome c biogenesis protein CcdA [Tepidibacter hydrothermalis]WFD08846.1 cytochrome c biogenesis protein CcdA [Tepidibacter hydrothermalis]
MGAENVSLSIAFGAGLISFFSPCILPLIPAYIMYITGVSVRNELGNNKILVLTRTIGFVIGFTIIFMIMGTSASFLGKIFVRNKEIFSKISGILIILFGFKMMGILNLQYLDMQKKLKINIQTTNWFTSILMGMAFAVGWTPCFGPVLASILIYAGNSDTISTGIYLLLIYSMGMAIPFILTALFIDMFSRFFNKTKKIMIYIPKICGFIMVVFGVLMFLNKLVDISRLFI